MCEESPFGLLRWCCTAQSLVRFQIRSRRNLPGQRRARGRLRSRHHRPHRHSRRFPRRCPRLFCPVAALDAALSSTLPTPALAAAIAGSISTALAAALTDAINIALAQAAPLARRGSACPIACFGRARSVSRCCDVGRGNTRRAGRLQAVRGWAGPWLGRAC